MGQRAEMAEAIQLLKQVNEKKKPHPRDPAEASSSGSAGVSSDVCWLGGGQPIGDVELGSETRVPNLTDGKPSKQKGEDHREQRKLLHGLPWLDAPSPAFLWGSDLFVQE